MGKHPREDFDLLAHTWWKIYRSTDESLPKELRNYITTRAFETLLKQCGWSISEWNAEIADEKKRKKEQS